MKKLMILLGLLMFVPLVSGALTDHLVTYYNFEQGSGDLTDLVGGNNNGSVITEGSGSVTRGITGKLGNAWNISASTPDNTNGVVIATNGTGNSGWGTATDRNFSWSGWVKVVSGGNFQAGTIMAETSSSNGNHGRANMQTSGATGTDGFTGTINNGTDIDNDIFNFVVLTGDTAFLRLYVNGTEVSKTAFSSADATLDTGNIGGLRQSGNNRGSYFNGVVDEIGIWNRTLTPSEVSSLWNNGDGLDPVGQRSILSYPSDNLKEVTRTFNFTASPSLNGNITNTTLYIYNSSNDVFLTNTTFINSTVELVSNISSNITLGTYTWNVEVCGFSSGGTGECSFDSSNFTYTYGYILNAHNFSSPVSELSSQTFTLNTSLISGLTVNTGQFEYNNSLVVPTQTTVDGDEIYTATITTPSVGSNQNVNWAWNVTLNDGSGNQVFRVNSGTQQINNIAIDDCTTHPRVIVNYTIVDEQTQSKLVGTTWNTTGEVELTLTSLADSSQTTTYAQNYSKINSFAVCSASGVFENSDFRLDVTTSYGADEHVTEFHNIQNFTMTNSSDTQNITLYDLVTTDAQEFLITFKDSSFLPVEDAIIDIQRKYLSEGVYKSVEIPKTDGDGQALGSLELSDVLYTFTVSKDGVTLGTFADRTAFCNNVATGDCKINLNVFASDILPFNFDQKHDVNYTLIFNESSRTVSSTFSTKTGAVVTVDLNVSKFDNFGNDTACSSSLSTSSGTISCIVPDTFGNSSIVAQLHINEDLVAEAFFSLQELASDIFGNSRIIMLLIMTVTLPLLALTSGVMTVVFLMVGVLIAILLNIMEGGSLLGVGSTLLWLVIAGGLIAWKISRRE